MGRGWQRLSLLASPSPAINSRRAYAVLSGGAPRFQVFNRRAKWLQKERAASKPEENRQADYLKDEVALRLSERLLVSLLPSSFVDQHQADTDLGYKSTLPQSPGSGRQLVQRRASTGPRAPRYRSFKAAVSGAGYSDL